MYSIEKVLFVGFWILEKRIQQITFEQIDDGKSKSSQPILENFYQIDVHGFDFLYEGDRDI